MRAYIERNAECLSVLKTVKIDPKSNFDQESLLFHNGESFYGKKIGDRFHFMDARLPNFSLPLKYVKIEN